MASRVNPSKILATDLDGTLIPLNGNKTNEKSLEILTALVRKHKATLVFVTGRHIESTDIAIKEYALPQPDWIVCDVGSTICEKTNGQWKPVVDYQSCLREILGCDSLFEFHQLFENSTLVRLQEREKQNDFKMSFYSDSNRLDSAHEFLREVIADRKIEGTIIASVDPFNGDGLLDVLPMGVSKAFALDWWRSQYDLNRQDLVFAGDSGNDLAAMSAGYKTIVVGNADADLIEMVRHVHSENGWTNRLHVSNKLATCGVLDGCRQFELL